MTWDITFQAGNQADIQNILNNAISTGATVIELTNDVTLTSQLNVPYAVTVKFTSQSGNNYSISGNERYRIMEIRTDAAVITTVYIGDITLKDGMIAGDGGAIFAGNPGAAKIFIESGAIIDGNHAVNGGAIAIEQGCVTMEGGTISSNHAAEKGGGIYLGASAPAICNAVFNMQGGTISNNTAVLGGGGIYEDRLDEMVNISGGAFIENYSAGSGGGMYVTDLNMTHANVSENHADVCGGGIYLAGRGIISGIGNMTPTISRNTAPRGGGICMANNQTSTLDIRPAALILENVATGAGGGGVWVEHSKLADLTVGERVVFRGNRAPIGFANRRPADNAVYFANIHTSSWSAPFIQGYNNFDISYEGDNPEPEPGCSVRGEQMADVCLPVSIRPFANVGMITTRCCGEPTITPGTAICQGTPDRNCDFTISQRICVLVPVEFGAEVTPGEARVGCSGNNCGNCPQEG